MFLFKDLINRINNWNELQKQKARKRAPQLKENFDNARKGFFNTSTETIPVLTSSSEKNLCSHDVKTHNISKTEQAKFMNLEDPFYDYYQTNFSESRELENRFIQKTELFKNKICPYCNNMFEKLSNQTKKCKNCGNFVRITRNIITNELMILTNSEYKSLQDERLNNDFKMYSEEIKYRLSRREYGLYCNAKYELLEIFNKQNRLNAYEFLIKTFELCYLNLSGPNNVYKTATKYTAPFNSKGFNKLPPGVESYLEDALLNYPKSLEEYHNIFINEMNKLRLPEQKMLPETAWEKIKKIIIEVIKI